MLTIPVNKFFSDNIWLQPITILDGDVVVSQPMGEHVRHRHHHDSPTHQTFIGIAPKNNKTNKNTNVY